MQILVDECDVGEGLMQIPVDECAAGENLRMESDERMLL